MRFSTVITLSLSLFTTAITAIAFPSPAGASDDCVSCASLIKTTSSCNYNMMDDDTTEPTEAQYKCMCKIGNFKSQYKECLSCMVTLDNMTSSEKDSASENIDTMCAAVTSGAGCLAVGPGKMIAAGAMAVGLGMYAL